MVDTLNTRFEMIKFLDPIRIAEAIYFAYCMP